MTVDRFTAIVRERYETGAYGRAFFRMSESTHRALCEKFPTVPQEQRYGLPGLEALLGIPVLFADVPDGVWELAERATPGSSHTWAVLETGDLG